MSEEIQRALGRIEGKLEAIETSQADIAKKHDALKDDLAGFKLKVVGTSSVLSTFFGALSGILTQFIKQ